MWNSEPAEDALFRTRNELPAQEQADTKTFDADDRLLVTARSSGQYTVDEAIEAVGFGPYQAFLVFYAGLVWLADAMEVILLSYIGPAAKCEWGLDGVQEGLISSVVFVGIIVGAYFFGQLSDRKGRRVGFFVTAVFTFVFGLLSAWSPHYWVLLLCRGMVGFGLGGAPVMFSLYLECLPSNKRGFFLVFIEYFWTLGTILEALLAWTILPHWHWRALVAVSALPFLILMLLFPWLPESPRFLASQNDFAGAREILQRMAEVNGRQLPEGELGPGPDETVHAGSGAGLGEKPAGTVSRTSSRVDGFEEVPIEESPLTKWKSPSRRAGGWTPFLDRGQLPGHVRLNQSTPDSSAPESRADTPVARLGFVEIEQGVMSASKGLVTLLSPPLLRSTLLLWFAFFVSAFTYYGLVLLTTEVVGSRAHGHCQGNSSLGAAAPQGAASGPKAAPSSQPDCYGKLPNLPADGYRDVLITSMAELPGLVCASIMVDWVGRRFSLAASLLLCGVFCAPLLLPAAVALEGVSTALLACARASIMSGFSILWVYAPELYPTRVRSTGLGVANCWGRIGGAVCPFIAVGLVENCQKAVAVALFMAAPIAGGVSACFFERETKSEGLVEDMPSVDDAAPNS